ncbi:phosphomannomutase [Candidatus Saccharibacteria bacterium]|nr:phosphomannomutase [Candidatus Saccharibacteria bacterium]
MTTLLSSLSYKPNELSFGTSGLRGLISDITDLEVYINTLGFIEFMKSNQNLFPNSSVYIAGDLRSSTPRILRSVYQAVTDSGNTVIFGGFVPTPAICYFGLENDAASIMVTGSHIPDDRNGIKFNKLGGEVLKEDEGQIKDAVSRVREQIYNQDIDESAFDVDGSLTVQPDLPEIDQSIESTYFKRYANTFANGSLDGKKIVFYEHSAVGRDLIPKLLESLGAEVVRVDRSDKFVPIDTENITRDNQEYFKSLAKNNPGLFAIISTDGDSDRPFVVDENGLFHRGDELGAVVAKWLDIGYASLPVSSNDAVDKYLTANGVSWEHTKIGSPYVIKAMSDSSADRVAGWEVNGGFLLGSDITVSGGVLEALPTRDAVLPILVALVSASEKGVLLSELFSELPNRYTQAGIIDNFPIESSRKIVDLLSQDQEVIARFFTVELGFGDVKSINNLDGTRILFANDDIVHIRPSGNAPQLRTYSVANSQMRADELVELAISEPDGILRTIESSLIS